MDGYPIREPEDQRGLGYSANGAVTLATAAAPCPVCLSAEAQSSLRPGLHRSGGCTRKLKVSTGVCSDVSSVLLFPAVQVFPKLCSSVRTFVSMWLRPWDYPLEMLTYTAAQVAMCCRHSEHVLLFCYTQTLRIMPNIWDGANC